MVLLTLAPQASFAQSVSFVNPPTNLTAGTTVDVTVDYSIGSAGIVQVQLFDPAWNKVAASHVNIPSGGGQRALAIPVGESLTPANQYLWQALIYTRSWSKLQEAFTYNVRVVADDGDNTPSVTLSNPPTTLTKGTTADVTVKYNSNVEGIVHLQLFDPDWNRVATRHVLVPPGTGTQTLTVPIANTLESGRGYAWHAILRARSWRTLKETFDQTVQVNGDAPGEWLPPGTWQIDQRLSDEFEGRGFPKKFNAMLGYDPTNYENGTLEFPIRSANGAGDPNTASMFVQRRGFHWLNGQGQLVMQIGTDKTDSNVKGIKVNSAYLISGRPYWTNAPPWVKWDGYKVAPGNGSIYISARIRTDEVQGWSTWFAFWLHSFTRSHNNTPRDGTEIDITELAKGKPEWMRYGFNVANHWDPASGSNGVESKWFVDSEARQYVNVNDSKYHVWGVEWSRSEMKFYVDGRQYYELSRRDKIPTAPIDMFMLLSFEFEKNLWSPDAGDGRSAGPKIAENATRRIMSRAFVDYVRVHRKN